MKLKYLKENRKFRKDYPDVSLPPDYLIYESYMINYRSYYEDGLRNSEKLKSELQKHTNLTGKRILDWGCGPARIIRHFPGLVGEAEFYATDYNKRTIAWNSKHIDGVQFSVNGTNPPTDYENDFFDVIYGLSVFTHLSEDNHYNWIEELHRIAKTNAVVYLTTHGHIFRQILTKDNQQRFDNNQLVMEGNTKEGHRTYAAFHPETFMQNIFEDKFEILEHIPGKQEVWGLSQDKWIVKKI